MRQSSTAPRLLTAGLLSVLAAACGGDAGETDDEAPRETVRASDTTTIGTPEPPPPNVYTHPPGRVEEAEALQRELDAARGGRYTLARVGGSELPATIGGRPGCTLQVVSGLLVVTGSRFRFQSVTRESCDGAAPTQSPHRAQGSAETYGDRLRLTTEQGGAFAVAEGSFTDGGIVIERLETEGGAEEVRWELDAV